jgi:hypothetical protein
VLAHGVERVAAADEQRPVALHEQFLDLHD